MKRQKQAYSRRPLRVAMLGLRSIDGAQGGVETHVRHLTSELSKRGNRILILGRSAYVPRRTEVDDHRSVRTVRLWAPRGAALEALLHSFIGVLYAAFVRPDILHIHAVGPGLVTPLARVFGLNVVFTHHGSDYAREKWGRVGKVMLKLGEMLAARSAHEVICISNQMKGLLTREYRLSPHRIPNGVAVPSGESAKALSTFALEPAKYILCVGRLVPEKRQTDLVHAFRAIRDQYPGWKLALVGKADHDSVYFRSLSALAEDTPGVVMCGFQQGEELAQLYRTAGVFVLPSSHEGHPIALLEAMAFGLRVIASDIPANVEIELPPECYVPLGNIEALADRLHTMMAGTDPGAPRPNWSGALHRCDWTEIAAETEHVYACALRERPASRMTQRAA